MERRSDQAVTLLTTKATVPLLALAGLTLPTALAVRNKDYAENLGGIGSAKDKILYELIDEDTIDSLDGYSLQVQLYYKTREERELHGNLILTTKDLPDYMNVKFGFLFTDDQMQAHYDGMHVETDYIERRLVNAEF